MGIKIGGNSLSGHVDHYGNIQNGPTVITDGLVLWLDSGNYASYQDSGYYYDCGYGCQYYASNPGCTACNTQWKDMSGLGNDGVLTNGPGVSYGTDGGVMVFDGVNDYVNIPTFNSKPLSTQISVEAWIKPTRSSVGTGTIRGGAVSCTNSMYLGIIDSTDGGTTMSMHWANQTSSSRLYNWNGSIPNNAWTHLMGTYDGSTTRAYLNGVEISSWAQSGTINDGTYVVGTYGGGLTDGVHNFKGNIAVARIYNKSLSAAEVVQNYNNGRKRFGV